MLGLSVDSDLKDGGDLWHVQEQAEVTCRDVLEERGFLFQLSRGSTEECSEHGERQLALHDWVDVSPQIAKGLSRKWNSDSRIKDADLD